MTRKELREEVQRANLVLVGLGEDLSGVKGTFYRALAGLLEKKDYYIVSLSHDRSALELAGLLPDRITCPLAEEKEHRGWERYLHWLSFTLNQRLCILELGAGFVHPEIIRFPFEKTCYLNQKSRYIRIHARFPQMSESIAGRGTSIQQDPAAFLASGQTIAMIDYDAGNIRSVEKAFLRLGQEVCVTRDKETLLRADKVVLPGVGAFGDAMRHLREYGLVEVIRGIIEKKTPFLGICMGLQLLFERSDEAPGVEGLGILEGEILKIPGRAGLKIPHMGWNSLELRGGGRLFQGLETTPYVYFVHSYYLKAADERIVKAITDYSVRIHAAIERDYVYACQFHPEKSGETGLRMLKNFADL